MPEKNKRADSNPPGSSSSSRAPGQGQRHWASGDDDLDGCAHYRLLDISRDASQEEIRQEHSMECRIGAERKLQDSKT